MKPTHVLFVCTGNAGRSQMAAALFSRLAGAVKVSSAGVAPWDDLHPVAVRLLLERGIDIRGRRPRHVDSLRDQSFDVVVTLGDPALAGTPELRGNPRRIHWAIPDPADSDQAGPAAQTAAFRSALIAIENRLEELNALVCFCNHASNPILSPGISTLCVVSSFEQPALNPERHLPQIGAAGFTSVELAWYFGSAHMPWDNPKRLSQLARIAADAGLQINSVHTPGDGIAPRDAKQRRFMVDMTRCMADAAALLGARLVVIHGGLPPDMEKEAGEAALRDALAELESHVLGMPCQFGWENDAPGLTADDHLAWIRTYNPGAFGLVLDVGHAHIKRDLHVYLEGAGFRLAGIHLHDNTGYEDAHRLPGLGTIAWPACMRGIAKTGYSGPLMLEVCDFSRALDLPSFLTDARTIADRLRSYAEPSS